MCDCVRPTETLKMNKTKRFKNKFKNEFKKKSFDLCKSVLSPNLVWDFTCPRGRFIDDQHFKNLSPTKIRFSLNFENPGNDFIKSAIFVFCFTTYTKRN